MKKCVITTLVVLACAVAVPFDSLAGQANLPYDGNGELYPHVTIRSMDDLVNPDGDKN